MPQSNSHLNSFQLLNLLNENSQYAYSTRSYYATFNGPTGILIGKKVWLTRMLPYPNKAKLKQNMTPVQAQIELITNSKLNTHFTNAQRTTPYTAHHFKYILLTKTGKLSTKEHELTERSSHESQIMVSLTEQDAIKQYNYMLEITDDILTRRRDDTFAEMNIGINNIKTLKL